MLHSRAYHAELILYTFDLLELDGQEWRPRTLYRLERLLAEVPAGVHCRSAARRRPS